MKYLMTTLFVLGALFVAAQEEADVSKRSEIKVNGLYLLLGGVELDYEYMLNEESSIGVSFTSFFDDDVGYEWGVTPHYRLFFGNQPALGFFVEGNASVFGYDDYDIAFLDNGDISITPNIKTLGGIGLAVGAKFKTKRNVVVEVVAGIGRTFGDDAIGAYPRLGINIGKRF